MKKMLIFVAIVSLVAGSLFADEAVLIDFTKLAAGEEGENEATTMDFTNSRFSSSLPESTREALKSSLAINNWEVHLTSSARTVANMVKSYVREATSKEHGQVLGVRIHFPLERVPSSALVKPPFEIPSFDERFQDGMGVITNVGAIKSIELHYFSLNFPHELSIILLDGNGVPKHIRMGKLNQSYEGWGRFVWNNPAYIQNVRDRNLKLSPLYPDEIPLIKFGGFEIRRDAMHNGGDFITYFRQINVVYDKAYMEPERDINDEDIWKIITERDESRMRHDIERYGEIQLLRHRDQERQATEQNFDNPERNTNNQK